MALGSDPSPPRVHVFLGIRIQATGHPLWRLSTKYLSIADSAKLQLSNPFSKSIHTYNFDKSLLIERPAIAHLIYDEKHGCFPSQKLVMCK